MTEVSTITPPTLQADSTRRNWFVLGLRLYITLITPVLLTLISVRLVMLPLFFTFEYTRPGFPADYYGFSTEDRLSYAPYALHYILSSEPISYLGDLRLPGEKCYPPQPATTECAMYNPNELRHMADVQTVTRYAFLVGLTTGVLALVVGIILWRSPVTRKQLRKALISGAIATLSLIAAIVVAALVAWDMFFTGFHQIFFESGTWRFAYSDTLIRLFPEQFWFDAALTIGALTVTGSLMILVITWRWGRRATRNVPIQT